MKSNLLRNPLSLFRSQTQLGLNEFSKLLNFLTSPAILLFKQSESIITGNTQAMQFTAYTGAELQLISLSQLLPTLNLEEALNSPSDFVVSVIQQRGGSTEKVVINSYPLDMDQNWILITFEPLSVFEKKQRSLERQSSLIQVLQKLTVALQSPNPEEISEQFLEAGLMLSSSISLALYKVDKHEPQLIKVRQVGAAIELPDTVIASDIGRLSGPQVWSKGKRINSGLHRTARMLNLNYLATVGIGDANSLFGILIAADQEGLPDEHLLEVMEVFASVLSNIFQADILINQLRKDNINLTSKLYVSDLIEENVQDGIIWVNQNFEIISLNPSAELMLGYATDEVIKEDVENVLIGANKLRASLKLALTGVGTPSLGNTTLHRRDGQAFPAVIQVTPVKDNDHVGTVIIILRDQSEHHQIKTKTQQLEQRALLGEITAIFAHEVRNPLNNISLALQLMDMQLADNDPNRELIDRMKQDTERLLHLMESILSFSRTSDQTQELVNLQFFLERLILRWQPRFKRSNITEELHVSSGNHLIKADEQSLEQVFTNLFSNSLRAMKDTGGTLSIKVSQKKIEGAQRIMQIDVSDTGIGIPPENLDNIFTPFFTTDPQGTGLGLAITQRIITAHKGNITVESFPGGGTVFHIQLPALPGTGPLSFEQENSERE